MPKCLYLFSSKFLHVEKVQRVFHLQNNVEIFVFFVLLPPLKWIDATNHCTKKLSFPLSISSVYVTKFARINGFVTFTEKILNGKLCFLCSESVLFKEYWDCYLSELEVNTQKLLEWLKEFLPSEISPT